MRTWTAPALSKLPGKGQAPRLWNTPTQRLEHPATPNGTGKLYACGITPYDSTHIGHAFTYLTYDLLQRAWIDAGITPEYTQNITDVDDPLFERARATGVNWKDLAEEQIGLFRSDMYQLNMLPPKHFYEVSEVVEEIGQAVYKLQQKGLAYEVDTPDSEYGNDIYFDLEAADRATQWRLGDVAPYDYDAFTTLFRERGGDPDREGKRDPLDPLVWKAGRANEPFWETIAGVGRPGWHIGCAVIATKTLGPTLSVQAGGDDLIFPHHELSAATACALTGTPLAHLYSHTAPVAYEGHKMSKSRGNLVFVSKLLDRGHEGAAIRLALLTHHYRSGFEWQDSEIALAETRLANWREGYTRRTAQPQSVRSVLEQLRSALANDLDTPLMLALIDAAWITGVDQPDLFVDVIHTLLGVDMRSAGNK